MMKRSFYLAALLGVSGIVSCGTPRGTPSGGTVQPGDPCVGDIDCTPGSICWSYVCVGSGSLRFSLSWAPDTDIDLHVLTPPPASEHIFYGTTTSTDGGALDVDDCVGGGCRYPGQTHVENIYWAGQASAGTYEVWAHYYSNSLTPPAGPVDVTIAAFGGTGGTWTETLLDAGAETTHYVVTF